jgi:hypothetical protein
MAELNAQELQAQIDEIDRLISEKKALINQMVGTLYPHILAGEIADLRVKRFDLCRQLRQ